MKISKKEGAAEGLDEMRAIHPKVLFKLSALQL